MVTAKRFLQTPLPPMRSTIWSYVLNSGYDLEAPRVGHRERSHDWSPEAVAKHCEQSLDRLKIDCIDLFQMHNARLDAIRRDDTFEELERLKDAGKIRHYAVCGRS